MYSIIEDLILSKFMRRKTAISLIVDAYCTDKITDDECNDLVELAHKHL